MSDPHILVLIDFCSALVQWGACSWFEQGDRLCNWYDELLPAAYWAAPEQHSYQLQASAPRRLCVFPSLPIFFSSHCIVYVTSDMKKAHGWLQDLSEVRRCFLASIKLTSEFNSPPCALPFFWHSGSRDILLSWDSHIKRLHIKAALFQKAEILYACFSPSNSHGAFNNLYLYIEYCVTNRFRTGIGDWGLTNGEDKIKSWEKKVRKESRRSAEWDNLQNT